MNPFEQFLKDLISSLTADADTARLSGNLDIQGSAAGDTVLETKVLPAGTYAVTASIRPVTDEGWVAYRLDKTDIKGQLCQVYAGDKTSTDNGPCPSATFLVKLASPGTFKLNYAGGENPKTLTEAETALTAVRIGA
jgi:hypothetical protein